MKQDEQDITEDIVKTIVTHATDALGLPLSLGVIPFIALLQDIGNLSHSTNDKLALIHAVGMLVATTIPEGKYYAFLAEAEYAKSLIEAHVNVKVTVDDIILKAKG